ncbi:MAG: competence/damage-inducible protein A [bacterium]
MEQQQNTAAIIIIGDEILSGRFEDQNSPFLIKQLASQGVCVKYCITIPDDREIIARIALEYSGRVDWVFTSGGIGPTPDDITMESLALAFKVPLINHPEIEERIRNMFGNRCTPEHLNMALVPEGTLLLKTSRPHIPVLQFRNITIFPGVPEFLRAIFLLIKDRFQGVINPVAEINLAGDEGEITEYLEQTLLQFPDLKLGSYPCYLEDGVTVKIVMEHRDQEYLSNARTFLTEKVVDYVIKD